MKRILLAGLLGGIAMFIWSSIAHMALPLSAAGVSQVPNEQALLVPLQATLGDKPGLYLYPGMDPKDHSAAAIEAYGQRLKTTPSGLLIYHPPGAVPMSPAQLVIEFATEVLEALMLAAVLSQVRTTSFTGKFGVAVLVTVAAVATTNVSYWNWYGFPATYTAAYITIELVAYLLAGAVAALLLRGRSVAEPVRSKGAAA